MQRRTRSTFWSVQYLHDFSHYLDGGLNRRGESEWGTERGRGERWRSIPLTNPARFRWWRMSVFDLRNSTECWAVNCNTLIGYPCIWVPCKKPSVKCTALKWMYVCIPHHRKAQFELCPAVPCSDVLYCWNNNWNVTGSSSCDLHMYCRFHHWQLRIHDLLVSPFSLAQDATKMPCWKSLF